MDDDFVEELERARREWAPVRNLPPGSYPRPLCMASRHDRID